MIKMYGRHGDGPYDVDAPEGTKAANYLLTNQKCWKCGGAGGADHWRHTGWTCFRCGGSGKEPNKTIRVYTQARIAELDAALERKHARQLAREEAKEKANFKAAFGALPADAQDELENHRDGVFFLQDLVAQMEVGRKLSEKQITAIQKCRTRRLQQDQAEDCPEGRITFRARLVSTKEVDSQYGTTIKGLWETDKGYRVWGTYTTTLLDALDASPDGYITIKATVTPSNDDPKFGFYKRPTIG